MTKHQLQIKLEFEYQLKRIKAMRIMRLTNTPEYKKTLMLLDALAIQLTAKKVS